MHRKIRCHETPKSDHLPCDELKIEADESPKGSVKWRGASAVSCNHRLS